MVLSELYFDYNATHPYTTAVIAAFSDMAKFYANPSSAYALGRASRNIIEETRELLASKLGVSHRELLFCSGATEANHLALLGLAQNLDCSKPRLILHSPIEHPSVLGAIKILREKGFRTLAIPVDQHGCPDSNFIVDHIKETALVSCMAVNNETGLVLPYAEIAAICQENQIPFHCDCVQAFGKIDLTGFLPRYDGLSASFSGHKLGAGKGLGVLYCAKNYRIKPLWQGGEQESSRRAGTENLWGIISLRAVLQELDSFFSAQQKQIRGLRDSFENALLRHLPFVRINAQTCSRIDNTSSVCFSGFDGESIFVQLDLRGISVSMGSACSSGAVEPSAVLLAMGQRPSEARSTLRFSFGVFNTEAEIELLVNALCEIIGQLKVSQSRRKRNIVLESRELS